MPVFLESIISSAALLEQLHRDVREVITKVRTKCAMSET
jgi:hypothetical protein